MAGHVYKEVKKEMILLTESSVDELTNVWSRTFDQSTIADNLRRLVEHAKNFYNDLYSESLQKESFVKNEVEKLRSEAEDLQRLLKTDVKLPKVVNDSNVPLLVVQREMDKSLSNLRDELKRRREQICDLLLEQDTLCDELGEPTRPLLDDPLPTAEELCDFRDYLDDLKEERVKRMQELLVLRKEIKQYLHILELEVNTDADDRLLNHRQIKLNNETFESLNKMRDNFREQVEELKNNIENMRQKLHHLWDRLGTPYEERRKIERYTECNQATYENLYIELERCENLKRQNLQQYIQKIRAEIEMWWDMTLKSDLQRNRFSNFHSKIYTDELLELHEMELKDLKQYFETNQQIFQLYNDRKILWERMTALEQKACDPARYNNRGGQLLKEEKERKTIATKLPKIEQQIKELVLEYQERENAPFLVFGEDILEIMEAEWKKKRQDKEAHSTARKNAVTPQSYGSNRSHISSSTRVPLTQRNASTVTLPKTPSSTNLSTSKRINGGSTSQKRKLNSKEKTTPVAKRSLWTSPGGVFVKPTGTVGSTTKNSSVKSTKPQSVHKKVMRVIATTINKRRLSGRLSGSLRKRRSLKSRDQKNFNKAPQVCLTEASDDENYDVFKNSIEPDFRSSIHHESSIIKSQKNKPSTCVLTRSTKQHQQKLAIIEEKKQDYRLATLPKPQTVRTPSKQSLKDFPISPGLGTSSALYNNRKLTTKNLPIII